MCLQRKTGQKTVPSPVEPKYVRQLDYRKASIYHSVVLVCFWSCTLVFVLCRHPAELSDDICEHVWSSGV